MRFLQQKFKSLQNFWVKTQRVEIQHGPALVQDSQDHFFTVNTRHGRKAEIDFTTFHLNLNTAILGYTPFCDVQIGHNFQAGDHRRVHLELGRHEFVQNTINSEANLKLARLWLYMDVTGPISDGPQQDHICPVNHRTFLSHLGNFADLPFKSGTDHLNFRFVHSGQNIVDAHFFLVALVDGIKDIIHPAKDRLNFEAGNLGHFVKHKESMGVRGGQGKHTVDSKHGDNLKM